MSRLFKKTIKDIKDISDTEEGELLLTAIGIIQGKELYKSCNVVSMLQDIRKVGYGGRE